jgi:hypothetical protein
LRCRRSLAWAHSRIELVTIEEAEDLLEGYAARGVFRGFSRVAASVGQTAGQATFTIRWHRDRTFQLTVNTRTNRLRMPVVLPEVAVKSAMDRELRQFVKENQSKERLEHRRIDPGKVAVQCSNRAGNFGLTVTALDGDLKYAIQKLIALVQEIYMAFLYDGRYYDYMVEVFDLDPDHM